MSSPHSLIPFNDLSRTPPEVMARIEESVARVLASGWYVMGPEHDAFEAELAAYQGVDHAVLLGNGTDALELALSSLGVGQGDEVLTVANAGAYTTIAARLLGARAVYADVAAPSLLMTPETLVAALDRIGRSPKVLVVTHLFGAMVDMPGIMAIARERGILVLEDCAQSLGAAIDGRKAGTFGDIATTSFYPTKNLGALGDGGAVLTSDAGLAETVRRTRQYGWKSKYHIGFDHGRNSRMDEIQAAILRVKLPLLDSWNDRRRDIHSRYEAATARMVGRSSESFTAHLAVLSVEDRDATRAALRELGVATDIHYPVADHLQDFPSDRPEPVSLPVTEAAAGSILSVPMFPELADTEIDTIVSALAEVVGD